MPDAHCADSEEAAIGAVDSRPARARWISPTSCPLLPERTYLGCANGRAGRMISPPGEVSVVLPSTISYDLRLVPVRQCAAVKTQRGAIRVPVQNSRSAA